MQEPASAAPRGRWSRLSLRTRTTTAAAAALLVGLAVASVLLVLALRSGLVAGIDDAALTRVADAQAALARGDLVSAVSRADGESSSVQVLTADGGVRAASPGLESRPVLGVAVGPPRDVVVQGRRYRALARPAGAGRVVVLTPLDDLRESTRRLSALLAVGAPALLALVCTAIWFLVGYTLHAVDRLRSQVAELSARGLDQRVDVPEARDEVRLLAETMNGLLDRLQEASAVQRRFVADAAHELRSPLAAVRTRLEVNARLDDLTAWQQAVPGLLDGTDRLAALVDDLLALARLDEDAPLRSGRVDLDELVLDAVRALRDVVPVAFDTRGVGAARVHGDEALLRRVVENLVGNASRYARTRVGVSLRTVAGVGGARQVELTVTDDGPGIPEAERERVFERFHRLDTARSRGSGGTGLGLAIVSEAVGAHGGRVRIVDAGPGAQVEVVLPAGES